MGRHWLLTGSQTLIESLVVCCLSWVVWTSVAVWHPWKKKIFEIYHTCKVTDPQYLRIRFCDVRAARAVRRAWSSQGWAGHIEHFPRRTKVAFSVPPHVQVRREGFYSWHSSSGGRQARDVYWTKEKINRHLTKELHQDISAHYLRLSHLIVMWLWLRW